MSNETQQIQAVYSSSDVSTVLAIQESTLRKYCLILEKNGYEFLKNANGHRAYFDGDIILLKKFLKLKEEADMTLEQASKSVIAWKKGTTISERDMEENRYVSRYNDLVEEFKSFKDTQGAFNQKLLNQLGKQQEYLDKRLEERDQRLEERDQRLMLALKETLETKKQLELAAVEEQKKKWWRFGK